MIRQQDNIFKNLDWVTISIYITLVFLGWGNIYAAVFNEEHQNIFDFSQKYGKQLLWIITAFVLATIIIAIDGEFYAAFAFPIYIIALIMLVLVLFIGTEISGSKSWFKIGDAGIQPAEFAKFATCLALAKYLSKLDIKMSNLSTKIISSLIIFTPIILIILENETGVALVYFAFIFVLYREGLSGNFLLFGFFAAVLFVLSLLVDKITLTYIIGGMLTVVFLFLRKSKQIFLTILSIFLIVVGIVFGTDYAFKKLETHQQKRINVFLGKEVDKSKEGYNVNQAMIAIGSGGLGGKGYLQGTQTKYDFVPEQDTDFIFCTVGEEWGFWGTSSVIILLVGLIVRVIFIAERQRSPFSRIYGYGVASILFFHLTVNIGMTIGLMPVIGIPLPFFSYGGSSLWSFTILLFIFLKLDAQRLEIFR